MRILMVVLLVVVLGGCARHVAYPATPFGEALKEFYEAGDLEALSVLWDVHGSIDPADASKLKATMLAILQQDVSSDRALLVATILLARDHTTVDSAEFRAMLPATVKGLRRSNSLPWFPWFGYRWSACASAELLEMMGPEVAAGCGEAVGKRFNAPGSQIGYESPETYTLYFLGGLLPGYGKEGVAALVQGLSNKEPAVRQLALEGLAVAAGGKKLIGETAEGWQLSAERREEGRQAALEAGKSPAVRERLAALWKEPGNKERAEEVMKALGVAVAQ